MSLVRGRQAVLLAAILLLGAPAVVGCGPRAILLVEVLGDSTGLEIDGLRVTLESVRLAREVVIFYPPPAGATSIPLPNSFSVSLRGDVDDGDELVMTVEALDSDAVLLAGMTAVVIAIREITETTVTLTLPTPCGNGTIDLGEACDGDDLAGEDCISQGWEAGALACASDCTFDTSACTAAPGCGDGVIAGAEDCDGANLGGEDCTTLGIGFDGGTLACAGNCSFDTSGCTGGPPSIPVLRKPMNGSYVGSVHVSDSLRPRFVWEASTGGGGPIDYEVEYSTDPTFASGATMIATSATEHMPAADLGVAMTAPVGARYYWRVRACSATGCSSDSPVWYVNVGRSDRDFDGDGYADVVVGAPEDSTGGMETGRAFVYLGGSGASLDSTADLTITGTVLGENVGASVASAGDVNGDGYADLLIGARGGACQAGAAYLFLGGLALDATPDAVVSSGEGYFGNAVAGAGDLNGDGYADLIVGSHLSDTAGLNAGAAYVYFGGPGAFDETSDGVLVGASLEDNFGSAVASGSDVDGDGFADVIVGARYNDTIGPGAGQAYLYRGGSGPVFDVMADAVLSGAPGELFGSSVASADVDDDGYADLIVGAELSSAGGTDAGAAYVFFGSAAFDSTSDALLAGEASGDAFGGAVAGAGDVDGDQYADIIVGARYAASAAGRVYVYRGGAGGAFDTSYDLMLSGSTSGDAFGLAVSTAGDVNADGYCDVVIGAPGNDAGAMGGGRAYVYFGASLLNTTIDGAMNGTYAFGALGSSVD